MVCVIKMTQGCQANVRREGQGTAGRCRRYGSIFESAGCATGPVAKVSFTTDGPAGTVACGEAPLIRAVVRISHRVQRSVMTLGQGRLPRILKIIAALLPHIAVGDSAKIDPDLRILMGEQRGFVDEIIVVIFGPLIALGPSLPESGRQRIG